MALYKTLFLKTKPILGLVDGNSTKYPSVLADPLISLKFFISADGRSLFTLGLELALKDLSRWMIRTKT